MTTYAILAAIAAAAVGVYFYHRAFKSSAPKSGAGGGASPLDPFDSKKQK